MKTMKGLAKTASLAAVLMVGGGTYAFAKEVV